MPIPFAESITKDNLMRAFAGESQARNRYTFSADIAKKQQLYVVEAVFQFTAGQELEHAEIFYDYLKEFTGRNITIDAGYPVDVTNSIAQLLRFAERNEREEYHTVYKSFGETAEQEGFPQIAASFRQIGAIEKTHSERFARLAEWMENDRLFISDVDCGWMCLNCGHVFTGRQVPENCPVCHGAKGYFVRLSMAPYTEILQ